jgi:hypothetical protein
MKPEPPNLPLRALRTVGAAASWRRLALRFCLLLPLFLCSSARAATDDENDEYQLNFNLNAPITEDLSGSGNFGYYWKPDTYNRYRFGWPTITYSATSWLQLLGGLDAYYSDYYHAPDTLELRPFGGVKLFVPNEAKLQIYNLTRYEYRDTYNFSIDKWKDYSRIRSRFGIEAPLTSRSRAWEPKTFYALADVEPFYRFDHDQWDPLRFRGGLGYILSDRVRIEAIYTAQFSRKTPGSSLEYENNILQLNIRIGFARGLLGRIFNPGSD